MTHLNALKQQVYDANMGLVKHGLVLFTWGNVSGIDDNREFMVIKPSGVSYDALKPADMVVVDIEGKVVDSRLKPSSDTATHLVLYRSFENIGGVVHTHAKWSTIWAQAGLDIPALGTTHADYFYGAVPCTRPMTAGEIGGAYEEETGNVIVERFKETDPMQVPGVLVHSHGPFTWGADPQEALHRAVVMEYLAEMAYHTIALGQDKAMDQVLLDRHFLRKHGPGAYYGQK